MEQILDVSLDKKTFPATFTFAEGMDMPALVAWYNENKELIDETLLEAGAILLKGAQVDTVDKFGQFTGGIASKFRDYVDGNYPRRNLKGHVYISTEYDANYDITMHNELSYSFKWPSKLFFGCIVPPVQGGETPLADSRKIVQTMDPALLHEFESKKVRYIRNLHGGAGMGPSWQETFATEDRKVVEEYCDQIDMKYIWKDNGGLRLENTRPATRLHPVTGEKVWFNQVDQYHPSHFPREVYETLIMLAEGDEEELPLYVSFGDGGRVTEDVIKEVIRTIDKSVVIRPWEKGDFVLVDNMLVAHGRKAYKGNRQIVVAMAD
jgi:alpha-ketoglutarate-dependent taurine dioxygenase